VVRDLNEEKLWGVNGWADPAIEEFNRRAQLKLGNLPVRLRQGCLEPRLSRRA